MNKPFFLIVCFLLLTFSLKGQTLNYDKLENHPRLLMNQGDESRIKVAIKNSPELKRVYDYIHTESEQLLNLPELTYKKEGKRLLSVSREAFRRIFFLSFMHRMTHEGKYIERAKGELEAVCAFKDWNPSHFLDTGEMTLAVAIGYDWLFKGLSLKTKLSIEEAIKQKGFYPSKDKQYNYFLTVTNNWNQVCNAGMVYGALALFETDRKEATEIIERALATIHRSMEGYAPNGNYPEGYNYWGYGTTFNVFLIAALESALGSDAGLCKTSGFMETARFMEYMSGTTAVAFNFSDARETVQAQPALFWFAAHLKDSSLLWNEKAFLASKNTQFTAEEVRFLPLILIYGSQMNMNKVTPPKNKMWVGYGRTPVALIRTNWQGDAGIYVGIKGGTAKESHAHMDAGSFVFEALGVRWADDLGMQEYYSLEKENINLWDGRQNGERWAIFRYNNFVHNTLTLNNSMHCVEGFAPIVKCYNDSRRLGVDLNLTSLFGGELDRVTRNIVLVNESFLQITDEVVNNSGVDSIQWTMVTSATPKLIDSHTIELIRKNKKLRLIIDDPAGIDFFTANNEPTHKYDSPNPGSTKIFFKVALLPMEKKIIKVRLVPMKAQ